MDGLKRVNLVVGRNNTGKTAFLEAAELLVARHTPKAWLRSPLRRGEVLPKVQKFDQAVEVRHMFFGRRLVPGIGFQISGQASPSVRIPDLSSVRGTVAPEKLVLRDAPASLETAQGGLVFEVARTQVSPDETVPISGEGWTWTDRFARPPCRLPQDGILPLVFVPADSLDGDDLIGLWDSASFDQKSDLVIDCMREVFPDLKRLGPLGSDQNRHRGNSFFVQLDGEGSVSPLGSLGDGVRRLLGVLLATVQAENGFVFIDDIDTGLHHSVMGDMWRAVFRTASRLDVQIFATTHSSDCWRSLGYLCASDPEIAKQVSVHRLERGLDHTIEYTPEELAVAAQQDIDIR